MSTVTPAQYWRQNKKWSQWLGKQGVVVASTQILVAPPELESSLPYALALVDFGGELRECLGAEHMAFSPGDKVEYVFRRLGEPTETGIVNYGLKVQKIRS